MSSQGQKSPKKAKPTFTYAVISVTMILLLIGVMSTIFFSLNKAFVQLKESIEIEIELSSIATQEDIDAIQKTLKSAPYINTYEFLSKDVAIQEFQKEINQDIVGIAGFNPLYDAFIITLKNEWSSPDSVRKITERLGKMSNVRGVNYSAAVIELVNANVKKVMISGLVVIIFLLIVAFSLIDNTIRLLMFSQRFLIRSMQLIGATRWFIIKPFILRGITAGVISGLLAVGLIGGALYYIEYRFSLLKLEENDILILSLIGLGIILSGVVICFFSTWLSVSKYLGMKLDELY
jgi:cell division transport system permease protein